MPFSNQKKHKNKVNGLLLVAVIKLSKSKSDFVNVPSRSTYNVESLLKIKTPRLITVSRYDKRKNHEKVIMALRNLKQIYPNIVYICIGWKAFHWNLSVEI